MVTTSEVQSTEVVTLPIAKSPEVDRVLATTGKHRMRSICGNQLPGKNARERAAGGLFEAANDSIGTAEEEVRLRRVIGYRQHTRARGGKRLMVGHLLLVAGEESQHAVLSAHSQQRGARTGRQGPRRAAVAVADVGEVEAAQIDFEQKPAQRDAEESLRGSGPRLVRLVPARPAQRLQLEVRGACNVSHAAEVLLHREDLKHTGRRHSERQHPGRQAGRQAGRSEGITHIDLSVLSPDGQIGGSLFVLAIESTNSERLDRLWVPITHTEAVYRAPIHPKRKWWPGHLHSHKYYCAGIAWMAGSGLLQ
eukprot:scaffold455_cov155-Ochromonas_danica.AAC.9